MTTTNHHQHVELPITGMTCASCASRIERRLNRLDGVSATVNYATEKATVSYDPEVATTDDLLGAVEAAGYRAVLPAAEPARAEHEHGDLAEDETAALRRRLVISAVLSFPVLLLAMVPALQFDNWRPRAAVARRADHGASRLRLRRRRGAVRDVAGGGSGS